MQHFKKLTGERVYLSPFCVEDAEKLTRWNNDLWVSIYLGSPTSITSLPSIRENLNDPNKNNNRFAIVENGTNKPIGGCSIWESRSINRTADLSIFIGESEYWSRGYGKEALMLLLDYGFNTLNLHNIGLGVYEYNPRAIRCYEKCGFKEYGRRRKATIIGRKSYDFIWMDILAEEFNSQKGDNKSLCCAKEKP